MAASPVGSLEVRIDSLELTAALAFTPDANGQEWSLGKAMRLVMDARLAGVAQKQVEEALAKFARSSEPATETLARGLPPELPLLEEPEWSDLAIPPEVESFQESVLRTALAPELYQTRVEKVSVERIIRKPGLLPFLPHREERVIEIERKEVKEPVALDTRILHTGYAHKGQRLAILSFPRPGKPGKSVRGRMISPNGQEDTKFYCGNGVDRNKNELLAAVDGFVRRGQRWVDILPFGLHSWDVVRSADKASFFLNFSPGDVRVALPNSEDIRSQAVSLGAPRQTLVPGEEITAALRKAAAAAEPLLSYNISASRDAFIEVVVSPDKLRATVTVRKGRGRGRSLDLSALGTAISRAKLVGMDIAKVKKDLLEFYKGPESDLTGYLLAEGRSPGRGKDRELAWSVAFLPEDQAAPLKKAVAAHPSLSREAPSLPEFPLEEARAIAFVTAGQTLGRLTATAPGQPGVSVHGQPLPGIPGNDPSVKTYENIGLVREAFMSETEGLVFQGEKDGEFYLRVLPYKGYQAKITVAPDASEAYLSLIKEEGLATPPTLEAILEAASAEGVVFGIDRDSVSEAILAARSGQPVENRTIARRKDAVAAGGVRVDWKVRRATGSAVTIREDGRADYRNQDRSTLVAENQPIVELIRFGGAGEDGMDVLGNSIKAPADPKSTPAPVWDASLREEKSPEGTTLLRAKRNGELVFEGNRLSIILGKQVSGDVGPASGNVRFPGAVQISGSVLEGYTVFAGGDVNISGSVEAALVSSDGAIRIGEGIKGRKKAVIRSRKTLEASFAEQALLLAVEDVRLKGACLLCSVKTNGRLILGGDRGALIGGLVRARRGAEAQILGSENGIKTEISFGQDYLLADQVESEEKEISRLRSLILTADKRMKDLEREGFPLHEIRQDKTKLMKLLEKRTLRIFDLRERFEEHHDSTIVVRGTIHPGVILESHSRFFEVRTRKERVSFSFDVQLGRIVERPLK